MARVTYLGNYRHHWCTEVHVSRELESLGHDVLRFQEPPGGGDEATLHQLHRAALDFGSDLLLWTRTWGLPRDAIATWRALEQRGVQTASFHLDLYVGLRRVAGLRDDPFWRTGTVFTPDGDDHSAVVFENLGINHVWSPPAVVSDECHPGTYRSELDRDVVFVGSPASSYHREWAHRGELLAFLERCCRRRGWSFERFGPRATVVRGQDLNDLYASARCVVGDSLSLPGHERYWSDRPYETAGRGGFLLMPRVPGLETHFTSGEHLLFWSIGDFAELELQLDWALDHPEERARIAAAGQAHVRENHTYRHRLERVMDGLGLGLVRSAADG